MAQARPALERLESSLRELKKRMQPSDPRKRHVNLLLLAVANKFGADAPDSKIQRIASAKAAVDALFGSGSFAPVMVESEAAVADL